MYIGVLEDEPQLSQYVKEILEGAGHSVSVFSNGADMVRAIDRDTIDLFVLDWRVPRMSGLEVLKHIREIRNLKEPVIFLTSRSDELDITEALNAGADDYCIKPLRPQEFLARLNAVVRRSNTEQTHEETVRNLFGYTFNKLDNSVEFGDQKITLTEKEFKLALFLFENYERPISRDRLINEAWGIVNDAQSRSLDVHVSWLRKKLNLDATSKTLRLKPIYGFGYRLMTVHEKQDDE